MRIMATHIYKLYLKKNEMQNNVLTYIFDVENLDELLEKITIDLDVEPPYPPYRINAYWRIHRWWVRGEKMWKTRF
jgi:hypothetical protein